MSACIACIFGIAILIAEIVCSMFCLLINVFFNKQGVGALGLFAVFLYVVLLLIVLSGTALHQQLISNRAFCVGSGFFIFGHV